MKQRPRFWWFLLVTILVGIGCGSKTQPPTAPLPEPTEAPIPPPTETTAPGPGASQEELQTIPAPPPVRPEAEGWADTAPPPVPESAPASISAPASAPSSAPSSPTTAQSAPSASYGYRVQVFASATRDGAERAAAEVRAKLQEAVTIQYEAPFYKVRVGNCVTRHEAERLKDRAEQEGYEGSFITETTIELE